MLATAVALVSEPVSATPPDTLQGISEAFASTIERNGSAGVIATFAVLALVAAFAVVRWLRREAGRERVEQVALEERRTAVALQAPDRVERRLWVRVNAHLAMACLRTDASGHVHYDRFETQNLGGGGLAFLSHTPPAIGAGWSFELDLGERRPLQLHGVVVRVDPPSTPGSPSIVALKFGAIENVTREHLIAWIAAAEIRTIAEAHRDRLCTRCNRPLANSADEMHSTCASQEDPSQESEPAREALFDRAAHGDDTEAV